MTQERSIRIICQPVATMALLYLHRLLPRTPIYYDGSDWDAVYVFSHDPVEPGESVEALILLTNRTAHQGRFYPGKEFEIREGNRVVARGRVTWVWTQVFLRVIHSETGEHHQS